MYDRLGPRQRGYSSLWDRKAKDYRRRHPLCAMCRQRGSYALSACVDHIVAHKGNKELFWDEANWQALCKNCHDSRKQSIEKLGYDKEVGADGFPVDPQHPYNKSCSGQT
jgi:5-methylcytosine-specific restriction protein A